jgi:hypothetical protein
VDDILDDLEASARRCERAAKQFDEDPLAEMIRRLSEAVEEVGRSSSQSWLGYQSTVYLRGFKPAVGGECFDSEWGERVEFPSRTRGDWVYTEYEDVMAEIQRRASVPDLKPLDDAAEAAKMVFNRSRSELSPLLDALISTYDDSILKEAKDKLSKLSSHTSPQKYVDYLRPKGTVITRDMRAMSGGSRPPHHVAFKCWVISKTSYGSFVGEVAKIARHVKRYLEIKHKMKGKSIAKTDGKITIGHGGSNEWRMLKEFIQDRLRLDVDEFNQSSVAGMTTKERLEQMLDDSCFAFLVMTAEDEHADGSKHARENVIHEIGLFQGRLGFRRAIILLDHGCQEFSNIHGISQIRFTAGRMREVFDEIRHVLEREGIIK